MRRLLFLITLILLIPTPVHADTHAIYLTSIPNRNYQGELTNKKFELSLSPEAELGKAVFQLQPPPQTWVIDAALVEDVQALAENKSELAINWMNRLKRVVRNGTVYATAYGNPDVILRRDYIPAIPGVNTPGKYEDYARDPGAYWTQWANKINGGTYEYFKP